VFYKCPNCEVEYNAVDRLARHWGRYHKAPGEELYLKLNKLEKPPKCLCGCFQVPKFINVVKGYRKFIRGHASRVPGKNNFVTKKAQENSAKTRRKMFAEGELQIWNKDLTKEMHKSIAKYGKSGSKTIMSNPEEIKARSVRMKKGRLNGTVRTLHGPEHSQWNGGTSSLRGLLKTSTKLYYAWKLPKLSAAKFTCKKCNRTNMPLHIHYDNIKMCEILKIIADKNNLNNMFNKPTSEIPKEALAMKTQLIDEIVDYHIQNNISGVVLCKECHGKEHNNLNFK